MLLSTETMEPGLQKLTHLAEIKQHIRYTFIAVAINRSKCNIMLQIEALRVNW